MTAPGAERHDGGADTAGAAARDDDSPSSPSGHEHQVVESERAVLAFVVARSCWNVMS